MECGLQTPENGGMCCKSNPFLHPSGAHHFTHNKHWMLYWVIFGGASNIRLRHWADSEAAYDTSIARRDNDHQGEEIHIMINSIGNKMMKHSCLLLTTIIHSFITFNK